MKSFKKNEQVLPVWWMCLLGVLGLGLPFVIFFEYYHFPHYRWNKLLMIDLLTKGEIKLEYKYTTGKQPVAVFEFEHEAMYYEMYYYTETGLISVVGEEGEEYISTTGFDYQSKQLMHKLNVLVLSEIYMIEHRSIYDYVNSRDFIRKLEPNKTNLELYGGE